MRKAIAVIITGVTVSFLVAIAAPQSELLASSEKLIAEGSFRQALEVLEHVEPSPRSHLLASGAWDGLNNPARAVDEAEAALALAPHLEAAHLRLGQIFLSHNTPQAALEVFSDALSILPECLLCRLGKGLALKELERYPEAEAELLAALSLKPDYPIAFDALATVYLNSKRLDDLERLASGYFARQPSDYRGPYFLAAALDGLRAEQSRTEALVQEALRRNPNFAAAYALLGKTLLRRGDAKGAVAALESALRLRPDYSPAAFHLAQAYRKLGREDLANQALARFRTLKDQENSPKSTLRYHRNKN